MALEIADKLFTASGTKPMIPYRSFWREVLRDLPDIDQLPSKIVNLSRPHLPYKLRNRAMEATNLVRKMLVV
jgi:hypothetical protein